MRYDASIRSLVVVARFYGEVLVLDFQKNDAGGLDYQGRNSMTFPLLVESSKQYNLVSSSYLLVNQSLLISMYEVDSTHRLNVGPFQLDKKKNQNHFLRKKSSFVKNSSFEMTRAYYFLDPFDKNKSEVCESGNAELVVKATIKQLWIVNNTNFYWATSAL